jgi:hypothetical protein
VTLYLKPETQAKLEAHAAALGLSLDDYLEALVERELPTECTELPEPEFEGQFQKERGIWVYRTGDPMPLSLAEETLEAVRRQREERIFGSTSR